MRKYAIVHGVMLAAIMCTVLAATGAQVIAAQDQTDQPAPQTQPAIAVAPDQGADSPASMPSSTRPGVISLVLAALSLAVIFVTRGWRLRRAPARPYAFTALSAFSFVVLMYLLVILGGLLGRALLGIGGTTGSGPGQVPWPDLAQLTAVAYVFPLAGVVLFFTLVRRAHPPALDRRASNGWAVAIAVATLLLIWPLVVASVALAGWITRAPAELLSHETLKELAQQRIDAWWLVMMAVVVVVAPIIEEVMYRGLLQEALRRAGVGHWPAITLTSILFTLQHTPAVPNHALVGLFVLALGLGWAYEKTGRLLTPIVIHALFNAGNLLLARIVNA